MPKLGMEPIRREALVTAAIAEIGAAGSLDVTVSAISKRAGMSSALAHHYFGNKDQIFLAAMRHILAGFAVEVRSRLSMADTPRDRLTALVEASFAQSCFDPEVISAWLNFYVKAHSSPDAMRLLRVYQHRLRSNLIHTLRPIAREPEALADTIAALIDGLYIRAALGAVKTNDPASAILAFTAPHLEDER
ncbi:choline-binding transcriptional repressor BetI [Litoreibacter arenae]|uniref:HTH-type transcriptional regulator BetI n=1 Tax=Litoreibacter arenae DSM 19593 TaxID=1123360 RepID=S9QID5_9RHOB|nr:transcriptional regulator BetI [Litoreibacter arenae]EPX81216.1 HTH-type transcriptional regulator BetI [Litoreibacter arenae DSM 19593]